MIQGVTEKKGEIMISAKIVLASIKKLKNDMTCDEYLKYKNNDNVISLLLAKYINDELNDREKLRDGK